jgi:hypothetical protein
MKRYTDEDVRRELLRRVERASYRKIAAELGMDVGYLYRIICGKNSLTAQLAEYAGFVEDPARWTRKGNAA